MASVIGRFRSYLPTRQRIPDSYLTMKNVALVLLMACTDRGLRYSRTRTDSILRKDNGAVQVQMHNVMYHFTDQVAVHLLNVGGSLVPTSASGNTCL